MKKVVSVQFVDLGVEDISFEFILSILFFELDSRVAVNDTGVVSDGDPVVPVEESDESPSNNSPSRRMAPLEPLKSDDDGAATAKTVGG